MKMLFGRQYDLRPAGLRLSWQGDLKQIAAQFGGLFLKQIVRLVLMIPLLQRGGLMVVRLLRSCLSCLVVMIASGLVALILIGIGLWS